MRRPCLFILVLIALTHQATAQLHNFKHYTSENGMPESGINALCQDKRGNLWIGTSGAGLISFDGYTFTSIHIEDSVGDNFVHAIYEDKDGKLLIGTGKGLVVYDGFSFKRFGFIQDEVISAIEQDGSGNYWIATASKGIYKYNGKQLIPLTTTQKGLVDGAITTLHLDDVGTLWIGTPHGLAQYNKHGFKFFTTSDGLPSDNIRAIASDQFGNVWLTTDQGASKFNGETFSNLKVGHKNGSNDLYTVVRDSKNNLWFGSAAGISKFDGNSFHHFEPYTGQSTNLITCTYSDTEGNLWFGSSEKGLSKLDSERFIHYPENNEMGKRVYSIIQAINGNIICGTSLGGTTVFDGKQYTLLDQREGFTSSIVQSFYYSPDSSLWVGTQDEGFFKFSKSNMHHYTTSDGLISNNITGFTVDHLGNMWVATGDSGVAVIQTVNDSLSVTHRFNTRNGLGDNRITSITRDRAGAIWLGTEHHGTARITLSQDTLIAPVITTMTTADGLTSNTIHTIITDSLGLVYLGTSKGISVYDGRRFTRISKSMGLTSNNIYSLTIDWAGNFWAGTEQGVDMIDFANDFTAITVRHYDIDEGFKGLEVYRNSSCVDRDGNIWFGTVNGLVKYNPKEDVESKLTPKIHITGLKLFFDNIQDTEYGDRVSAWYSLPQALTLPYNQNNLTFSFTGIYHRNPEAVRYRWKLEGFGPDWSPAISDRAAVFSNLPPGDYTFKVIACNEYNVWTETPASFSFSIQPPVWERWWARALGFALLVMLIWMIFHIRLQRIKARNKVIQERLEMERNILELEQEAARLQMNPHFIFNCLNSIQGFISVNDAVQAKRYLAKFARLMRLILENAREEFIPVQNEVDILSNYLELEKLSANNKFDFSIHVDEAIDTELIQIPPMMIQPFVENAIVHGIKKKEAKGNITISFQKNDSVIICTVQDDGVGRKKAGEINGQIRKQHKSTGISVTVQRLQQYGEYRQVNAGVEFIDLHESGIPTGTRVVISTPFEQ